MLYHPNNNYRKHSKISHKICCANRHDPASCCLGKNLGIINMRPLKFVLLATVLLGLEAVATEEAPAIANHIKWATASELNNFGFDVFRGEQEDGAFEKINEHTIAGAGNSDTPSRYEYTDAAIEPGKVYWYYVESISMSGQREKFTPTFKSKPKYPVPSD